MKTIQKLLLAAAFLTACSFSASGQIWINATQPYSSYSIGATNAGTLAYVIIGAHSANNGTPVVTAVNATTDKSTAKLQFYKVLRETVERYDTNNTVVLSVDSTNGFASGDVIIIRHLQTDTYEKRILTTMTSATNLTVTVTPYTTIPGDVIYGVSATGAGSIPVVTNSIASPAYVVAYQATGGIYSGQKGMPLLMEIDATTTGTINFANARFDP